MSNQNEIKPNVKTLLQALLNYKAIIATACYSSNDNATFKKLIQFDENDQLVEYILMEGEDDNEPESQWIQNEDNYFHVLDFLNNDLDCKTFEIVDRIEMEAKLSIRQIMEALIDDQSILCISEYDDGKEIHYHALEIADGWVDVFQPKVASNPNGIWEDDESGMPPDDMLNSADKVFINNPLQFE